MPFVINVLLFFLITISLAAYLSLYERKLLARIQLRRGPAALGPAGIFQPIADALKLFLKRGALVGHSKRSILSVCMFMFFSLVSIAMIPISEEIFFFNSDYSLLIILVLHPIFTIIEMLIGTESGSKYGTIGGVRAYFQSLSSSFPYVLSILCIALAADCFNIIDIVSKQKDHCFAASMPILSVIFFIVNLISLNKTPFDNTEAESEIVAGNYVEYGGMLFGMIYLSEYVNLMFASSMINLLFFGGWHSFVFQFLPAPVIFGLKNIFIISLIFVVKAILPRYKQESAIEITWKILTPISLIHLAVIYYIVYSVL